MKKLSPDDLAKMLLTAYRSVDGQKEEINKINVFPVPDQDTGSNLAATLKGIAAVLENKRFVSFDELARDSLDAALSSAQGNEGVIFTGFLAGFLSSIRGSSLDSKTFAAAFKKGAGRARLSIQNPREGTVLDVVDAAAGSLELEAPSQSDIAGLLKNAIDKAEVALVATRQKIEILKRANVVDAGGLGFLVVLQGWFEALVPAGEGVPNFGGKEFVQNISQLEPLESHRYEVAALVVQKEGMPLNEAKAKDRLKTLGDFIDVVAIGKKMRVHIHTDRPDDAKKEIENFGSILTVRVQDLSQTAGAEAGRASSIGIVCEDMADITPKIADRYKIAIVPAPMIWPEGEPLPGNLYQKMAKAGRRGITALPKTSAPVPKSYVEAYKQQLILFDKVLCITTSAKISGSYNVALQAKGSIEQPERVTVVDSRQVAAPQALVVLRALELIGQGWEIGDIAADLEKYQSGIKSYIVVDDPKWLVAGGRLSKTQAAWIRHMQIFHLRPLITVEDGALSSGGIVFAKDKVGAIFEKIKKDSRVIRAQGKRLRAVIIHADDIESAKRLKRELKIKLDAEVSFVALASPAIGAHGGPGTLMAAWAAI